MTDRELELWHLIVYQRDATPEQLREWCRELTSMPDEEVMPVTGDPNFDPVKYGPSGRQGGTR